MNNYVLSHGPGIRLFNYTATFRRESDYPLTLQWLPSLEYLLEPVAVSLEEKNRLRREGLAPVLYMQSHCDVPSDRDRYVKELMKYIKVKCRIIQLCNNHSQRDYGPVFWGFFLVFLMKDIAVRYP